MEVDITLLKMPKSWDTETDIRLLEACQALQPAALAAIFDRYAQPVYSYILCFCMDPVVADQGVGEVFAKFLDQLTARQRRDFNLRLQLFRIAYQIAAEHPHRSHPKAGVEVASSFHLKGRDWLTTPGENEVLETLLRSIIVNLSDDQRHVIVLHFLEGFSLLEIANIMGKKAYNIGMIYNRGLARLRKFLVKS